MLHVGIAIAAAIALTPAAALAAPQVESLRLDSPPIVDRTVELRVTAVDPDAPLANMVVNFGRGEGAAGTSSCRPPDSRGRAPGGPFAPGSRTRLAVPHDFASAGAKNGLLRLTSGGCGARGASVLQPFTVEAGAPGDSPDFLKLGTPVTIPQGSSELPSLPGVDELPDLPPAPPLPLDPSLPSLPSLSSLPSLPVASAAASCRYARRPVGRSARARAKARRAVLCVLNAIRRGRRLRALRGSRVLGRAAFSHARSMVRRRFWSHVGPGGVSLVERLRRVRFLPSRRWMVGENLAYASRRRSSPEDQVIAWMESTPHRANILEPRFRLVGVGIARGTPVRPSSGATYTADFGARR